MTPKQHIRVWRTRRVDVVQNKAGCHLCAMIAAMLSLNKEEAVYYSTVE
jgi:hypothetical protein